MKSVIRYSVVTTICVSAAICACVAVSGMAAGVPQVAVPAEGLNIVTVAGTGVAGYSGDDVPATAAQISNPRGPVVSDVSGNLYFADSGNNRARQIEKTTGKIRTVVGTGAAGSSGDGGPAVAAKINNPNVAIDSLGNLYVSEFSGHRVRKVDSTGIITTVIGNGVAGFSGDHGPALAARINVPRDVAFDHFGNLYLADGNNNRVRKVEMTSGIITTVAGTGVAGALGDGGSALDARLSTPHSLAFDSAGSLTSATR
jgi:sugar lactone lactonase YvrE